MPERHILVVDDDDIDQFIAQYVIRSVWPNCQISTANDGVEALDVLERLAPDDLPNLIFLDINMPRMNGHDFLEQWFVERDYDVPVVVMVTSSDHSSDRERAGAYHGVRGYAVKPLTTDAVLGFEPVMAA